MPDGRAAVRALSWSEVVEIVTRFAKLNPYADKSHSILKMWGIALHIFRGEIFPQIVRKTEWSRVKRGDAPFRG